MTEDTSQLKTLWNTLVSEYHIIQYHSILYRIERLVKVSIRDSQFDSFVAIMHCRAHRRRTGL